MIRVLPNELSALVDFAGDSVDHLVLSFAQSLHQAVAGRVFGAIGPLSAPVRFAHDRLAATTYSAVRGATSKTASLAASSVKLATGDDLRLLSRSRRGRAAIGALNALSGDVLEARANALAIPMSVRQGGVDVQCERKELRSALVHPTRRLALFIHGLGETEEDWWRRSGARRRSFGARLKRDLNITPIYLRYNSGLHISENGSRLSDLMEQLVQAWPLAVGDVALIGHSMGGLLARAAYHAGRERGHRWLSKVRHVITLGSPHTGVPLEKLVHVAAWVLRVVPESRPIADILDRRSAGIRDLRFGYLVEEDWRGEKPARLLHNNRSEVPPLEGCTHTFVSATVARSLRHPLSWIGGDLLVATDSAAGRRSDGSVVVSADAVIHLDRLTHFDLLDHPLVYQQMRRVIAEGHETTFHRSGGGITPLGSLVQSR
jgi:pimeloyl-ACP methyl ester carboxylesterase